MVTLEDTENTEDVDLDAEAGPETLPAHRFPFVVRTQRVLQIVLGLFWLLDAALQFQPFMFGQGFVGHAPGERVGAALRRRRPDHAHRQFRVARHRGVERVLRADSAGDRVRPAVPAHRATGARPVLRVGPRCLVLRRGHGHAADRHGLGPHGRTRVGAHVRVARSHGVAPVPVRGPGRPNTGADTTTSTPPTPASSGSGSRPRRPPRASAARSRPSWCGLDTGRSPRSCSSCRTTARRRRCTAPSWAWCRASRVGTGTS